MKKYIFAPLSGLEHFALFLFICLFALIFPGRVALQVSKGLIKLLQLFSPFDLLSLGFFFFYLLFPDSQVADVSLAPVI